MQRSPVRPARRLRRRRCRGQRRGTGPTRLRGGLDTLPVDILKIDRSLLTRVSANGRSPLIDAAVALAHGLGLHAVAEGVETTDQADYLRRQRCDSAQGFLFARPTPWPDLPSARPIAALATAD